ADKAGPEYMETSHLFSASHRTAIDCKPGAKRGTGTNATFVACPPLLRWGWGRRWRRRWRIAAIFIRRAAGGGCRDARGDRRGIVRGIQGGLVERIRRCSRSALQQRSFIDDFP